MLARLQLIDASLSTFPYVNTKTQRDLNSYRNYTGAQEEIKHSDASLMRLVVWQRDVPSSRHVAKLTHLDLRQVLVRPHEEGGEERLERPQVGEEAVDTEQEGRPQ